MYSQDGGYRIYTSEPFHRRMSDIRQRIMDSAGELQVLGRLAMLKCGDCTFFREPDDGNLRGGCTHREKYTPTEEEKFSWPQLTLPTSATDNANAIPREYEQDCRYGYQDVWAARGAARLIAMQKPPEKKAPIISSGTFNKSLIAGMATLGYLLTKKK